MDLSGRMAVITGAARGIGFGCAEALAMRGAEVILADRDAAAGRAACSALEREGLNARFRALDVTDEAAWAAIVAELDGKLDVLINCAGRTVLAPILETSWQDWRGQFEINLGGAYIGTRTLAPLLANRADDAPWASIVNISSMAAISGVPLFSGYAASKAALSSFTKSAALEFAQAGKHVRVNAVLPGTIDTDMSAQTRADLVRLGGNAEKMERQAIARHPIGRTGVVADVVHAVMYLVDDNAGFTTGTNLTVSGGRDAL